MKPARLSRPVFVSLALIVCPFAAAQTSIEPPVISPGARSLGLGGAFVAVADDATAAYANPSGLMQLVRPEISAELRSWSDDRQGLASNLSSLGFLSFVLPRQRWSLAVYGQTLASLEFPEEWWLENDESAPLSGLVIANAGISAALSLGERVSFGFGVTVFAGSFSEGDFPSSDPFGDDEVVTETGATAGILWNLDDAWAIGASYRSGADFRFEGGGRAMLPDILAAGARWRSAGGHATIAAELEQLNGLENRTRLHLGGEWVFLQTKPLIGLRAGGWHDPKGGVVSSGESGQIIPAEGVLHASAGIGLAWKKFQLDVGGDFSDRTTIASISGIFTF